MAVVKKGHEPVYIYFHNEEKDSVYTATTTLNTTNLPVGFMVVPENNNKDLFLPGSKVHWDKLNRSVKGVRSPHQNKGWITRRFNELTRHGWDVMYYPK